MTIDLKLKNMLLLTSLVQGLALLFLRLSIKHEFWPSQDPQWLAALYTVVLAGPLLLLLSLEKGKILQTFKYILSYCSFVFFVGYYVGSQVSPVQTIGTNNIYFMYAWNMVIATFLFQIYLQQYLNDRNFSYAMLFKYSWRNFLTVVVAGLFTVLLWGILMLWAQLFKLIQIDFFDDVFNEDWFYYPVLTLAFGFAISILRSQSHIIDTIKNIQQILIKYLLLVLILVLIIFVFTFPFTGLQTLWDTRSGSTIILWLQALVLFFINAVYQGKNTEQPYNKYIHRYVYLGVALLPIYSAISFYGLALRINQYGWTIDRCWGIFIWAIFALFSLGYLFGIIKKRDNWIDVFDWVNVRMGMLLLAALMIVNTPLVDFRKISVSSQLDRIGENLSDINDEDIRYFNRELGVPGYEALQMIKEKFKKTNPDLVKRIDRLHNPTVFSNKPRSKDEFISSLLIRPLDKPLPEGFTDELYSHYSDRKNFPSNRSENFIIIADFDNDMVDDYLFLVVRNSFNSSRLFKNTEDGWINFSLSGSLYNFSNDEITSLRNGQFEILEPKWNRLKVGDKIIGIME